MNKPNGQNKPNETGSKKTSRKKGCFIFILIVLGLVVYSLWQIGEPGRRAKRIHAEIRPGMNFENVEKLLTGRHFCHFEVNKDGKWHNLSRDEFIEIVSNTTAEKPNALRLKLHFMGTTPRRVSFTVELDNKGNVTKVTDPYGWD